MKKVRNPIDAAEPDSLRCESRAVGLQLARKVAALPEQRMRVAAIVATLQELGGLRAAWVLETLIRGALEKRTECLSAYDSLLDPEPIAAALASSTLADMLAAALDEGCVGAMQWLHGQLRPEPPKKSIEPERLIAWGLREMTLGDRRALARRARGNTIDELVCDPDAGVITNLLNNPRLTEGKTLVICARRPTVPPPLNAVLRSQRWIPRYRVKLALARNPYMEPRLGLNLLVYLKRPHLLEIRDDESLSPSLRLGVQRLLDVLAAPAQ